MLSFLAKFGAPIPDREILGGHTGRMKSVLTYSRDSLASPLRVLNHMLECIRQGSFNPNATRSGMMTADVKVEVLSVEEDDETWEPVDRQQQDLDEEAGEDLGSGSDTSSSSEEEQAAATHAARMVSAPKAPAGTELRQHPKSRMLHLIQEDHKRYLGICFVAERSKWPMGAFINHRRLSGGMHLAAATAGGLRTHRSPPDCGKK